MQEADFRAQVTTFDLPHFEAGLWGRSGRRRCDGSLWYHRRAGVIMPREEANGAGDHDNDRDSEHAPGDEGEMMLHWCFPRR